MLKKNKIRADNYFAKAFFDKNLNIFQVEMLMKNFGNNLKLCNLNANLSSFYNLYKPSCQNFNVF
jgi:hypothetical protein